MVNEVLSAADLPENCHKNIIFIGYKSSGKTYFGELLSKNLGWAFIDTDHVVESNYETSFGEKLSCREISLKLGEKTFRSLEAIAINALSKVKKTVVSVGGGAVLSAENVLKLQEIGIVVFLEADKEILKKRMFEKGVPAFLDKLDPEGSFEKMYQFRKLIYEQSCRFKITLKNKKDSAVLDELKALIAL